MRPRHLIAVLGALIALALIPAVAGASISDELTAGGKAEQAATHYWPKFDFVASCDQQNRSYFWCDVIGDRGNCFWSGHAGVTMTRSRYYIRWTVQLRGMNRACY